MRFGRRTFPRPPISLLGGPPPKFVPERTKVWRNGTRLAGKPNIEIGGRGELPFPTSPEDMAELSQQLRSVLFSKFCLTTEHGVAFLPLKTVPRWPPWALERPTAKKPQARRAPESFWQRLQLKRLNVVSRPLVGGWSQNYAENYAEIRDHQNAHPDALPQAARARVMPTHFLRQQGSG